MISESLVRARTVAGGRGLVLLAALVVLTAAAVLLGAPMVVNSPLVAATVILVSERVVRRRGRGLVDTVLAATMAPLVAAVLLGVGLNLLPGGLTVRSWAIGGALVALGALAITALVERGRPRAGFGGSPTSAVESSSRPAAEALSSASRSARPSALTVTSLLLAVVILSGAWLIAVRSTQSVETAPLALSVAPTDSASASAGTVLLTSGTDRSGLRLTMLVDGDTTVVADGLAVGPDAALAVPVTVPTSGRAVLQLTDPALPADPGRELIFDNGRPEGT